MIGEKKLTISVEIVKAEIPLLIGANSMETAGAKLDFEIYCATFFGEEVKMTRVGTGHVCIDLISRNIQCHINDLDERDNKVEEVLANSDNLDEKSIKRLHHLYGHTSARKLSKFLIRLGKLNNENRETLEGIGKSCEACIKTQRERPKPKSIIPRVDKPNEIVTIDLKHYEKDDEERKYICYFID